MGENKITQEQMQALMNYASKRLGTTPDKLAKTVQKGGIEGLASSLSPQEASKVNEVLSNKKKAEQLLNSPEAQKLIQQLLQNKGK